MSRPKQFDGEWYDRNKTLAIQKARQWQREHPEQHKLNQIRFREHVLLKATGLKSRVAWSTFLERKAAQGGACLICEDTSKVLRTHLLGPVEASTDTHVMGSLLCPACLTAVEVARKHWANLSHYVS